MEINQIPAFIKSLFTGDAGSAALAGALGGLVRWLTLRDNWREGLAAIVVGAICAEYVSPLIQPILGPGLDWIAPGKDTSGTLPFLVGLGGVSITGIVIDIFKWRRKSLGKGNSDP